MNNNLIDAIQQVITPNGKKAISAESLANLLIDIVSAIPEGNGGSGQVVFYAGDADFETMSLVQTAEEKAHNAEMYKIMMESPISLSASVDATKITKAEFPFGEDVNLDGLRCNSTSEMVMYVTDEIAASIGLPHKGILLQCAYTLLVSPDGTVEILNA